MKSAKQFILEHFPLLNKETWWPPIAVLADEYGDYVKNHFVCIKTRFSSKEFADQEVKRLKKTSIRDQVPIRSYLCEKCGAWHLTKRMERDALKVIELQNKVKLLREQNKNLMQVLSEKNIKIKELKQKINFRGSVPSIKK